MRTSILERRQALGQFHTQLNDTQLNFDATLNSFSEQVVNPSTFVGLAAGGLVGRLFGMAGFSALGSLMGESRLAYYGARVGSFGMGLAAESAFFVGSERVLRHEGFENFGSSWAQSVINLGTLKIAGIATAGQSQILQRTLNSSAMVVANQVAGALDLVERPHESLTNQFISALVMDIQSSATRSLVDLALPSLGHLEKSLEFRQRNQFQGAESSHVFSEVPAILSVASPSRERTSSKKAFPTGFALSVESTTQFLHDWYAQIVPELRRDGVELPDLALVRNKKGKVSIRNYAEVMEALEAARITSPDRIRLANRLRDYLFDNVCYQGRTLREAVIENPHLGYLDRLGETTVRPGVQAGLAVEIPYEGQLYRGVNDIDRLANRLVNARVVTPEFAAKIQWIARYAEQHGGTINLKGRIIPVSGLIAEMINARDVLKTGATVFGIDFNSQAVRELAELAPLLGGTLIYSDEPINILTQAAEIAGTINDLARRRGEKVHMLNLAYAGNVELPLMGAMMAITERVHREGNLASVGYLLSTSMPAEIPNSVAEGADMAYGLRPQFTLASFMGLRQSIFEFAGRWFGRRVFPPQGPGYLGSQIAKPVDQDHWLGEQGVSVSANTAPMTGTASLLVKIRDRAKRGIMRGGLFGARKVGIYVADVDFTNRLMLFAYLHDILNPEAAGHAENRNSAPAAELAQRNAFAQASGRVETNDFGASVRSITNWAFLRHLFSFAGWFGRKSIYFSKEGMPFSHVQSAREIEQAGTWVLPSDPAQAEAILAGLKGPLAQLFGAEGSASSQRLVQAGSVTVGRGFQGKLMAGLSAINRVLPVLGSVLSLPKQGLYGSLAMNSLRRVLKAEDRLLVEVDGDQRLISVRTQRPDGEGLGYRLSPGVVNREGNTLLQQVIYLGQPVEGRREVVIPHEFNPKTGELKNLNSGRVNPELVGQNILAGNITYHNPRITAFERMFGINFGGSLTGPIQFALANAFGEVERNPRLGIDASRVEVREIRFGRVSQASPTYEGTYTVNIRPTKVAQEVRRVAKSDKQIRVGDMIEAQLRVQKEAADETPVAYASVRLRVSGNRSVQKSSFEEALVQTLPVDHAQHVTFKALSREDLAEAAAWSDPNPRHQRNILVQAATGRGGADLPGFLIAAQSESLLRTAPELRNLSALLSPRSLVVRTLRSVEPGQEYQLRVVADTSKASTYHFQWIHPKTGKVHVDGDWEFGS